MPEYGSWTDCIEYFWSVMSLNQNAEFEMVILYAQAPGIERTFSFMEKLAAFTHKRLEQLVFIPRNIILLAVAVQWDLSPSRATMARRLLSSHNDTFIPAWEPQFPSHGSDMNHGPFKTVQTSFTFRFPTKNTLHEFFTDLHTYVFRPFSRQPKYGRVDIFIFVEVPTQAHKILIVADLAHVDSDWLESGLVGITGQTWEEQIFRLMLTMAIHVRSQYSDFLDKAWLDLAQASCFRPQMGGSTHPPAKYNISSMLKIAEELLSAHAKRIWKLCQAVWHIYAANWPLQ
ncbi:hypothetical protein SLS54_007936 [Diplodia seriata]